MTAGVYLIQAGTGLVKIGHAGDIEGRLRALQTGSALPLALLHAIETDRAKEVERILHRRYRARRRIGEWFALTSHDVSRIRAFSLRELPVLIVDEPSRSSYTVKQVADRLQIGQVTVLRWLRSGKLAGVKPGGTRIGWRVPVSEVERLERGQ